MRCTAAEAEVLVFTFKEGLLSGMAHDLKLKVHDFTIDFDNETSAVRAEFAPESLRVVCARRDGADEPEALSVHDLREIDNHVSMEVLHPARFSELRFEGCRLSPTHVRGSLTLHGQIHELDVALSQSGEHWLAEAHLDQRIWGIRPYSAVMGALKVRPEILVQVRVPLAR